MYRFLLVVLCIGLIPQAASGQSGSAAADSLREYELSEIVIGGEESDRRDREPFSVDRIPLAQIVRQDAADVAGVMRLLPSAHVQTNSRGETLVYIRGAGERQVAVFLDGALLNIPWDNRVDLSLLPANILGGVTVARGAVSAAYGTNVSGGAVNLQTRDLQSNGNMTELTGQVGTADSYEVRAMHARRSERTAIIAAATLDGMDGYSVPHGTTLPFSQEGDVRLNTDRRMGNAFVRIGRSREGQTLGLSVLHVEAEKGVAPESHLNPQEERVRYWRYPLWRNTMAILNGRRTFGDTHVGGTAWMGRFQQHISQFESASYTRETDLQKDLDLSAGLRGVVSRSSSRRTIRLAGNVLVSRHDQVDLRLDQGDSAETVFDERFGQILFSTGGELEWYLDTGTRLIGGATFDGLLTPGTGDKPARDPSFDYGLNAGLTHNLAERVIFRFSGGRKVRFPTMRELFGEALNSFLVNPDLTAERTWLAEVGVERTGRQLAGEFVVFVHRTFDTIDRRNVVVDGTRFRQRVNLEGSRVWGLEVVGGSEPAERVRLDGQLTWMRPVGFEDGQTVHLVEKPEVLGTLTTTYTTRVGVSLSGQAEYTGRAWSLAQNNEEVALPRSIVFNARVAGRKYFPGPSIFLETYLGVDNVTDEVHVPQLGLPSAGRMMRVGLSASF